MDPPMTRGSRKRKIKLKEVLKMITSGTFINCGDAQNKIEEPNECEAVDECKHPCNESMNVKPNDSEVQISSKDNHHKVETNLELDEVKQISVAPVIEGSAKKRRRMGMCRMSEKERSQFLSKFANKVEISENTVVTEENMECPFEVLLPQQQTTEIMQRPKAASNHNNNDDRSGIKEETTVETAATGTIMMCEPLSKEAHISEDDPNRTCTLKSARSITDMKKSYKGKYYFTTKTDPEALLTVPVCEALSPITENWKAAQKLDLGEEQQSETKVHLNASSTDIVDAVCVPQNPEIQTTKVHADKPPELDQTATTTDKENMTIEQEPQKELDVTPTEIHKQHTDKNASGDHTQSEYCSILTNVTEEAPIEQEPTHQSNTADKTSLENLAHVVRENPDLIHTSAPETNYSSMDNNHMMNSISEEKKSCDANSSPVRSTVPPQAKEYVTDSQLNTIDMIDQVMDDGSKASSECYEDATELVGGLIRELSSLNRTVMATHRELENLRRRGKNSRNPSR
ncbi:hypothetical protein WMY93_006615 [Mugilogobius chulae]|uniref:Uncharacterized protein n=1 Tax=Mugilogobius chulae TaxID=88201 RepID=A0AAW0PL15_9GOBI